MRAARPLAFGAVLLALAATLLLCVEIAPALAQRPDLPVWVTGETFTARPAPRATVLTGYTRPRFVMDLVSEEEGRCLRVAADVGDALGRDGLYATLDTTFIDLDLKRNGAEQERLKADIAFSAKEVERYRALVERDLSDQSSLDRLSSALARQNAELAALRVEEARLKERRTRFFIRGKPGWRIIERAVQPGEWVRSGASLGRAGDFSSLLVPLALSPEEFTALNGHDSVTLRFPDMADQPAVAARVERVSPDFDPETRKTNVDLLVTEGLPEMRGGLRAELTLEIPDPSGAVLAPTASVLERYEEHWLVRTSGELVKVFILGPGPDNTSRVRGEEVRPGDVFLVEPVF